MTSRLPLKERLDKQVRQPKELCAGTVTGSKFELNDSALRYYYFPDSEVGRRLNLGTGYGAYRPKVDIDNHLDAVLEGLMLYEEANGGARVPSNIICWRGILTQIMTLIYDNRQGVDLHVQEFGGQIFIEHDFEAQQASKLQQAAGLPMGLDNEKFMYSGVNFEKFATLKKPWGTSTREEIQSRYKGTYKHGPEYCSIVSAGVGSVKLIYGAEIDCVEGEKDPSNALARYVELKTTGDVRNQRQAGNLERKLAKSWAQSFLVGTKKIVYAYRDRDLNLKAVEELPTDKIPSLIKHSTSLPADQKWNGKEMIKFLAIFVAWLKDTVKPNQTYSLKYTQGSPFLELKPKELNFEKRLGFLPGFFVQYRVKQMQAHTSKAADSGKKEGTSADDAQSGGNAGGNA